MDRGHKALGYGPVIGRSHITPFPRGWVIVCLAMAAWLLVIGIGFGVWSLLT